MTSLTNIEEFLEIDLTNNQLRNGKKRPDKNRYYCFTNQYYIVQLSGNDKWCIMSSNQTTRDLLADHVWYYHSEYARTDVSDNGNTTKHYFHRMAIDCDDDMVADHINRNRYDNRTNLREMTHTDNMRNRTKNSNNTSGKNGIHKIKKGRTIIGRRQSSITTVIVNLNVFQ